MHIANITEAKTNLSQLIKRALAGHDVVIARGDEPLVKLTPIEQDLSPRVGGQWAGKVEFHGDFRFTDDEIDELFSRTHLSGATMTPLLLDTCTLIYWATRPDELTDEARLSIGSGRSFVFVSAASAMEIAIKRRVGKLTSPTDIEWLLRQNRFNELPVTVAHAEATTELPMLHKDPFDRLIVAQARCENLTLVTRDRVIKKYDVPTIAA